MTTTALERTETAKTTSYTQDTKLVIYPNGDFINYNYVTKKELESYLQLFYSS